MEMYRDADGHEIKIGMIVGDASVITGNAPIPIDSLAIVVGRHMEENNVFIRYMGNEHVYRFHPARLRIASGRGLTSLASAA